jgi:hypothetical protein
MSRPRMMLPLPNVCLINGTDVVAEVRSRYGTWRAFTPNGKLYASIGPLGPVRIPLRLGHAIDRFYAWWYRRTA